MIFWQVETARDYEPHRLSSICSARNGRLALGMQPCALPGNKGFEIDYVIHSLDVCSSSYLKCKCKPQVERCDVNPARC